MKLVEIDPVDNFSTTVNANREESKLIGRSRTIGFEKGDK